MATHLEISGAHKRTEAGNVDWYYGGGNIAWDDLASAKAGVPSSIREGKTIGIIIDGKVKEYIWHPSDITDSGLVEKSAGLVKSTITGNQDSMSGGVGSGYVNVPDITSAHLWNASYEIDGVTYWVDNSQLQSGAIYSFPTEGNFTYTINYIL